MSTLIEESQTQIVLRRLAQLGVSSRLIEEIESPQLRTIVIEPIDSRTRMHDYLKVKRDQDLAFALGSQTVRIVAPIPGRRAVAIEVPRDDRQTVTLDDLGETTLDDVYPLRVPIGVGVDGERVCLPIANAPQTLVVGQTGSGKSSALHTIIAQCARNYPPGSLDLVLIDLKRTELTCWDGDPHLREPVAVDADEAMRQLRGVVHCMENRYRALQELGVKDVHEANAKLGLYGECIPYVVLVCDEFAKLMMVGEKEAESLVIRLAQEGRAAGIHMVIATQYALRTIINGLLRVNAPTRLAFAVPDKTASRLALDCNGAESLLGKGDGLLSFDGMTPTRFQAAQTTQAEIDGIKEMWS